MGKTIYIDLELDTKKARKQAKEFVEEMEKSAKRTKKNIKVTPEVDDKKIKKVLGNIKENVQVFTRDTGKAIDMIRFNELENEVIETDNKLKDLKTTLKYIEAIDGPNSKNYIKLKKEINRVNSEFTESKKKLQNIKNTGDETLSRLQKKFNKVGNVGTRAFTKIAGAFAALGIVGKVKDFIFQTNAALTKLQNQTGMTTGEVKKFEKAARNIQKSGIGSFSESIEALSQIRRQMELTGEEAENVARKSIILEKTFGIGTKESIDAADKAMIGFGISSDKAYDIIATGLQQSGDASGDFIDTIREYSSQIAEAGGDFESFANKILVAEDLGIRNSDQFADMYREALIRVKDGSDKTRESFGKLGLSYEEFLNGFEDGSITQEEMLETIASKILEVKDPLLQNQVAVDLLGTKYEDNGIVAVKALASIEDKLGKTTGKVDDMANVIETSLGGKINIVAGYIGERLNTAINGIIKTFTKWRGKISQFSKDFPILSDVIEAFAIAIGILGTAFGVYSIGAWAAAAGTTALTTALGILLSPVGLVIAALTGLVAAGVYVYQHFDELSLKLSEAWDYITQKFSEAGEWFKQITQELVLYMTQKWNNFVVFLQGVGASVQGIFNSIGEIIKIIFDNIVSVIQGAINTIKQIFGIFTKILTGDFQGAFNEIKGLFDDFFSFFGNFFTNLGASGSRMAGALASKAVQWGYNLIKSMGDGIKAGIKWVKQQGEAVAGALFKLLGVNSPTKEGPLAVDQSKWGLNLVGAIAKGINKGISKVKKAANNVAKKLASLSGIKIKAPKFSKIKVPGISKSIGRKIGVEELVSEDLEKLDTLGQVFGEDFMQGLADGMKSKNSFVKQEAERIYKQIEEVNKLSGKYKSKKSISDKLSKLNSSLDTATYNSDKFNKIKSEIEILSQLQRKYNGELTDYEKDLSKIQEKSFDKQVENIENRVKEEEKGEKSLIKNFKTRASAYLELQEIQGGNEKQQIALSKKIIRHREKMGEISKKIYEEEKKSIEKLAKSIEDLQKQAKNITEKKDTSIAERKLEIEKERKQILEDIAELENSGTLGNVSDRVKNINEKLEGGLSESERNRLLEHRSKLLEDINHKMKSSNILNGKAYELKKQLLALNTEEEQVDKYLNTDSLEKVKEGQEKTKTDKILDLYEEEKKKIEEKLDLQIETYNKDIEAFNEVNNQKALGEQNFTSLIHGEINKRIGEQGRLLDNARRVAAEMAKLGFDGGGFTASFKKIDEETGKVTTVKKTVNITNNNTIKETVDVRKLGRSLGKQIARAEASGNIL